jgi:hypothetical protein
MLLIIDDSEVALSASINKGGLGYFETHTSTIDVRNKGIINTGNSMNDMGGIAYMMGTNNYLKVGDGAQVTACGSKKGGGCFYFGGTAINKIQLVGGINGDAMIHNSELSCSTLPCNGGIFYLRGSNQRFDITGGTIANVRKVIGNGGIIYSDPYSTGATLTFEKV